MQVDAIKEGTADFRHISLDLSGGAGALVRHIVVIPAGTGIHRSDKHKIARQSFGILGATDGYLAVFERLPHGFEDGARKFRQFVKEKHAIMGQTDSSRLEIRSSSD